MPRPFFRSCLAAVCLACCALSSAAAPETPAEPVLKNEPGTTKGVVDIDTFKRPKSVTQLIGKESHLMVPEKGPETNWTFKDGELTASKERGGDSVITPEFYGDMLMYVEFNVNDSGDKNREKNGNSGVYIQQRYELQITNAHGVSEEDYKNYYCGSLYRMKKPDKLVSKPAGEWQQFIIVFRAPRWDGDKKTENARITVYHNGELIHDDVEMKRKTGAGHKEGPDARPTRLQGHQNPVRFRNMWVKELDLK